MLLVDNHFDKNYRENKIVVQNKFCFRKLIADQESSFTNAESLEFFLFTFKSVSRNTSKTSSVKLQIYLG